MRASSPTDISACLTSFLWSFLVTRFFGIGDKVINVFHILLKKVSVVIVQITDASKPTDFLLSLECIEKCI